jgi:hypothetical protein
MTLACIPAFGGSAPQVPLINGDSSVTVPFTLDHNRMLVEAEIQAKDGTCHKARLWVDTGNASFYVSDTFASDLGIDLPAARENIVVPPPAGVRIGGMPLDFQGVRSLVMFEPRWLFTVMHEDANLPSTVLERYQVVFDYPRRRLTIAAPGSLTPRGVRAPAAVDAETGIVQIDAVIDGDSLSFALDNGASYSFVDGEVLERFRERHPDWPRMTTAIGCANMWGWWPPAEQTLYVMRVPEILWGPVRLADVGVVGVAKLSANGPTLGAWYSQKTARPVNGFLGPNAFKAFRVEIDYAAGAVYFERADELVKGEAEPEKTVAGADKGVAQSERGTTTSEPGTRSDSHDMDLVGLALRPEADLSYTVIAVATKDGKPSVEGVEPGDKLLEVDGLKATGATMGTVIDALRGVPGETRTLILERNGKQFKILAPVARFL